MCFLGLLSFVFKGPLRAVLFQSIYVEGPSIRLRKGPLLLLLVGAAGGGCCWWWVCILDGHYASHSLAEAVCSLRLQRRAVSGVCSEMMVGR